MKLCPEDAVPCLFFEKEILFCSVDAAENLCRLSALLGVPITGYTCGDTIAVYLGLSRAGTWWDLEKYISHNFGENWLDDVAVFGETVGRGYHDTCGKCPAEIRCDMLGGYKEWRRHEESAAVARDCMFLEFSNKSLGVDTALLKKAGFWPSERPMHFDSWRSRGDLYEARSMDFEAEAVNCERLVSERGVGFNLEDARQYLDFKQAIRRHPRSPRPGISSLHFDVDNIRCVQVLGRARSLTGVARTKAVKEFKKKECTKCVYECAGAPWTIPETCALTEEEVLDAVGHVDKNMVRWMAMFAVAGVNDEYVGDSGRKRAGVSWGPSWTSDGMRILSLVPPFNDVGDTPLDEYLEGNRAYDFDEICRRIAKRPQRILRLTYWALKWMHKSMRYRHSFLNMSRSDDRFAENDVLAITLKFNLSTYQTHGEWRIEVLSDTRASNDGGFGGGGNPISASDRPRFSTEYNSPFFEDLHRYAGNAVDSGRGDQCLVHLKRAVSMR